jgi:2-dehydropantoate 2-reductase
MKDLRIAVVGVGATGSVLAAALLSTDPHVMLVDPRPGLEGELKNKEIRVSGAISYQVRVTHFFSRVADMGDFSPNLIFLSTKTFHLSQVLEELEDVFRPGTRIVSTHNGLGTEDLIADKFGSDAAFRMSLNYGAALDGPGEVRATFFNKPNHLGGLTKENSEFGSQVAKLLTESGLDTEFVDDIKLYVWKKMIMKCTMAPLCAITDMTIKEALDFAPTREIADACFREALAVSKAEGYDLGEGYLDQALGYLENVGAHKDSMCQDIANETPTEIDFLGGKIVEYGRARGVPTPFYLSMTNLVKAIEAKYLGE